MKPILVTLFITFSFSVLSQDYRRFEEEVATLIQSTKDQQGTSPIIFTGSSSIRLWDTKRHFPKKNIINHGFGGSETSDLVCYVKELVLSREPGQVFIYEGDNDLANGKSIDVVIADMKTLLRVLKRNLPQIPIHIISPKPSVSRWNLKDQYQELNEELKALCDKKDLVTFVDVWSPMLNKQGKVNKTLFIEDGLHLNENGYGIWRNTITPYLN